MKLSCYETQDIKSDWTNDFEYKSSGKHWGKTRFSYQNFQQLNDELTINLQIRVLKMFDAFSLDSTPSTNDIAIDPNASFLYG